MPRLLRRAVFSLAILLALFIAACAFYLAEANLHRHRSKLLARPESISVPTRSTYSNVEIVASDGAHLRAWLFLPSRPHPGYVIALHGVGDTRAGVSRIAQMLLNDGYAVLAPDSRAHGESDGDLTTYGILEAPDVHAWADYLFRTQPIQNLYALGESMGAAVVLQALPLEPRIQAAVAECPYSTFDRIAHDRIFQTFHTDALPIRLLAGPIIATGLAYAQFRYHVDLESVSPLDSIRHVPTPILLIHGLRDTNVYPQHSRELLFADPRHITPWFVPNAGHTKAYSVAPAEFEERVTTFFQIHQH